MPKDNQRLHGHGAGTRQRLMAAALSLFAARGYARVSVGQIEAAAGLAPRAGSFYKHFPSKRDVLVAALDQNSNRLNAFQQFIDLLPLGDARAELTLYARWGMQEMKNMVELQKLLRREADQFPDLVAQWHDSVVEAAYAEVVRVMDGRFGDYPAFKGQDTKALAALLLGAIVNYILEEDAFGTPPADVGEERFISTWVEVCSRFLGLPPSRDSAQP